MPEDVVAKTIETYDKFADEWIRGHSDFSKIEPIAMFFMDQLKGKAVLDAGCGHGRAAKYFSEKELQVTGVDLSRKLLEAASKAAPNVTFKKADIRKLDFHPNTFDGIWACASLQHIPKAEMADALLGLRRVLKPNGTIYVSIRKGEKDFYDNTYGQPRLFSCYSMDEFATILAFTGFPKVAEAYSSKDWISMYASAREDFPTIPSRKL